MNKVSGSIDQATIALANTEVDDFIDAAFSIGTPTELEIVLDISVVAEDGGAVENLFLFSFTVSNYHATTVNTTLKNNLDPFWAELEDLITDSGKYTTITQVYGTVQVEAIE